MSTTIAVLFENPGLLAMTVALAIGAVVFGGLGLVMASSDASLRPIMFVGGLFLLVLLPQFAYHCDRRNPATQSHVAAGGRAGECVRMGGARGCARCT